MDTAAMQISAHKTLTIAALNRFEDLLTRKKQPSSAILSIPMKYLSKTLTFDFLQSKKYLLTSTTNQIFSKEDLTFILTIDPITILKKTKAFKGIQTAYLQIRNSMI